MDKESRIEQALINDAIERHNEELLDMRLYIADGDEELGMLNYKHLKELTKDYLIHYIMTLENTIKKSISNMDKETMSSLFFKNEKLLSNENYDVKVKVLNMQNNHIRKLDIL